MQERMELIFPQYNKGVKEFLFLLPLHKLTRHAGVTTTNRCCMHIPVRVIGKDITYEGMDISMYIDAATVKRAYTVYPVKDVHGKLWRCVQDHEGAELVAFKLWCSDNEVFTCSEDEELQKLGLSRSGVKTRNGIGFTVGIKSGESP